MTRKHSVQSELDSDKDLYSKPELCGFYSITKDRKYDESDSSLRYFKMPKVPLDLNEGLRDIVEKPDSYYEEKMDSILTYIAMNKTKLFDTSEKTPLIPSTTYITYRGVIRMIMCSPFEKRRGWSILATKYKGNIYFCQLTSAEERNERKNKEWNKKKICLYGPKFEQFCLTENPSKEPNTSEQLEECSQFFCIFKRKLAGRNFLFAGEMDGVVSDKLINLNDPSTCKHCKFIELKTTLDPKMHPGIRTNFNKYKSQITWTQSYLTGVNDVYFGFRDNDGIVNRIEKIDIYTLRKNWQRSWYRKEEDSFKFLQKFLSRVEKTLLHMDDPYCTWQFNYNEENSEIRYELHENEEAFFLLPDWYLDAVNKKS